MSTFTKIQGVDEKKTAGGKAYWIITTAEGKMTAWSKPIADKCIEFLTNQQMCEINASDNNGFLNLRVMPKAVTSISSENISNGSLTAAVEASISASKPVSRVSLTNTKIEAAKDIFICLYSAQQTSMNRADSEEAKQMAESYYTVDAIMDKAVSLVNQAELGFDAKELIADEKK